MDQAAEKKLQEIVKKNYQEIAEDFNLTRKKHLSNSWEELIEFAGKTSDGAKILDLGCGNGRLLKAFEDKKIDYIGIDLIPELVSCARENFGNEKTRFIAGDILELDKAEEIRGKKFDYIFCLAVFHHLPGQEMRKEFLKSAAEYLTDEGKLFLTVWNIAGQSKFWPGLLKSFFKKIFGFYPYDFGDILFPWQGRGLGSLRYYHAFTVRGLKKAADGAGLKIEKLFKDRYNYYLIAGK